MALFFRVIEVPGGLWSCRQGRFELDMHPDRAGAILHLRLLAAAAEGPVEIFLHRRDGTVEQVPTLLEPDSEIPNGRLAPQVDWWLFEQPVAAGEVDQADQTWIDTTEPEPTTGVGEVVMCGDKSVQPGTVAEVEGGAVDRDVGEPLGMEGVK